MAAEGWAAASEQVEKYRGWLVATPEDEREHEFVPNPDRDSSCVTCGGTKAAEYHVGGA